MATRSESAEHIHPVAPDGSLASLADGYRGLLAWRAVRGTSWIRAYEEIRQRDAARAKARAAMRSNAAMVETRPDVDEAALAATTAVVVTGLPRSGTSMLMQMLDAAGLEVFTDRKRTADESNPRGYYEHAAVKDLVRDASWVPEADGRVVKVVAPLLPFLPAGPAYRVLFLERDLGEVLRSQASMLGRLGRHVSTTADLRPVLERQVAAAHAWIRSTARGAALVLAHHDVIAAPAAAAARIASFLGRDLDIGAMAAVVDPSLHRERAR